jgi:hypothetical protein
MTNEQIGKAYGFFDCNASKEAIESELPTIREFAQSPLELELALIEGVTSLQGDEKLRALARQAKDEGMRYVLESTCPGRTNRETADEVADILNQTYNTPLYEEGERFNGATVFEEEDRYQFRN